MKRAMLTAGAALIAALHTGTAHAWDEEGHFRASQAAVAALPTETPAFFRHGAITIAGTSMEPDFFRLRSLPQIKQAEDPDHYIDLELLNGQPLPPGRYQFIALCAKDGLDPAKVGLLPYAVAEWTQRLTMAFAEHRRWPDNPNHQQRCLIYAGILAHYAQDATMPLHTTIHYDGWTSADGKSPRTGIHARVDALIHKVAVDPNTLGETLKAAPLEPLWEGIVEQIEQSHALIGRVYELENELPDRPVNLPAESKAAGFAQERLAAAAEFTASLYLTAWRTSATIELPDWYIRQREATEPPSTPRTPATRPGRTSAPSSQPTTAPAK